MFSFAYPWLFALLPLPWFVRAILPARRRGQIAVRVPFGQRLRAALDRGGIARQTNRQVAALVIPSLVWILVVGALARPQWIEPPVTKNIPTRDLLLLVDLSGSMNHEDFVNAAGETVDRLTAVKAVLGDFLSRREGDRVGLVVFGDAPYLQAPFTTDLFLARRLLDQCEIGMAGSRTALGDGIGLGVTLFEQSNAPAKTMIALTDGNDTKSQVPPVEAARVAADRGIRVYTVAMGDPTTVGEEKLDEQVLRDVAEATGGSYFFAADRESLEGIYTELDRLETREINTVSHRPRRELFYWPLAVALLLSMAEKLTAVVFRERSHRPSFTGAAVRVDGFTGKLEVVE